MKLWTDGRTTEAAYTKSSPGAFGSGELKNQAPVNSLNMTFFDLSVLKHIKRILRTQKNCGVLKTLLKVINEPKICLTLFRSVVRTPSVSLLQS